jgi:hypothetical protein
LGRRDCKGIEGLLNSPFQIDQFVQIGVSESRFGTHDLTDNGKRLNGGK